MLQFFQKIMGTSVGKAYKLFNVWHNMPNRRDDKAFMRSNKFELKLSALSKKSLKISLSRL